LVRLLLLLFISVVEAKKSQGNYPGRIYKECGQGVVGAAPIEVRF